MEKYWNGDWGCDPNMDIADVKIGVIFGTAFGIFGALGDEFANAVGRGLQRARANIRWNNYLDTDPITRAAANSSTAYNIREIDLIHFFKSAGASIGLIVANAGPVTE